MRQPVKAGVSVGPLHKEKDHKTTNRNLFKTPLTPYKMSKETKTEKEVTSEKKEKPSWVMPKQAELEKIIIDLHKQGESPAKIGLILRDKHGVPKVKLQGKRISEILKQAGETVISERTQVEKKIKVLEEHRARHKHDYCAQRSLTKKLWLVRAEITN